MYRNLGRYAYKNTCQHVCRHVRGDTEAACVHMCADLRVGPCENMHVGMRVDRWIPTRIGMLVGEHVCRRVLRSMYSNECTHMHRHVHESRICVCINNHFAMSLHACL